jgi:hypothetical protein
MQGKEYYQNCETPSSWFFAGIQNNNAATVILEVWKEAISKPLPRIPLSPTTGELSSITEWLWKSCDLFPAYMMLAGYALENIAKGLELMERTKTGGDLAGRSNLTAKDLGFSGKDGHMTLKRLDRLGIPLDLVERNVVQIAEDHVIWAGRYCIPLNPGSHASDDMPNVIKEWSKYADAIKPLFDRLCKIYRDRALQYFSLIF